MTVPQRLCFSAQLSNCNLSSCWHIEFSILSLPHLSISIHLRIRFGCSMKFFQLRITLGLALGESWPLLAQPQKNTDVYKDLIPGKAFPSTPAEITFGQNKDVNSWIKFRLTVQQVFCARLGRSLCHGNELHGNHQNILSSGHHESWLFHKGCVLCTAVKLQSCHMLPRRGTYWRMLICSLLHISFMGTIASVVLSRTFIWN